MSSNSRITKKDLERHVHYLNKTVLKNKKNRLAISSAYGGYEVVLTGKTDKRYKHKKVYRKDSLRSAVHSITNGHDSARKTNEKLLNARNNGDLEYIIDRYEHGVSWSVKKHRK